MSKFRALKQEVPVSSLSWSASGQGFKDITFVQPLTAMKRMDVKTMLAIRGVLVPLMGSLFLFGPTVEARGFDCLIEPNQLVELRSPVEGLIGKTYVNRGDIVRKGQLLIELQSDVERGNVALAKHRAEMVGRISTARSRVEYTTKKLERMQELLSQNYVAQQARDDAQAENKLAISELRDATENQEQARLEQLRAVDVLKLRSLRSPFDGVVVERVLNVGELAEAGTGRKPLLKLAQINPLRVEVLLTQKEFGRIQPGSVASVKPQGFGVQPAKVIIVDKVIDAASGMFGIRLELSNPQNLIPGGIHCAVDFPGVEASTGQRAR